MFEYFNKNSNFTWSTNSGMEWVSLESLELNVNAEHLCGAGFFFTLNWFVILLLTQHLEIEC